MHSKTTSCIVALAFLLTSSGMAAHTPAPGSEERRALCDAVREYVVRNVGTRKLPQPIVFKVAYLRVDADYAWFEGIPVFKDGSDATKYLPDMDYMIVLEKTGTQWKVRHNLSRSDVPDESESAQLRKTLTPVPSSILPDFWRKLLRR